VPPEGQAPRSAEVRSKSKLRWLFNWFRERKRSESVARPGVATSRAARDRHPYPLDQGSGPSVGTCNASSPRRTTRQQYVCRSSIHRTWVQASPLGCSTIHKTGPSQPDRGLHSLRVLPIHRRMLPAEPGNNPQRRCFRIFHEQVAVPATPLFWRGPRALHSHFFVSEKGRGRNRPEAIFRWSHKKWALPGEAGFAVVESHADRSQTSAASHETISYSHSSHDLANVRRDAASQR